MPAVLPKVDDPLADWAELLAPDLLDDGELPERRVVYSGLSWERYLAVDKALGDDRSGPRLFYLEGELEIVTTSNQHERIQRVVSFLVDEYFEREGTDSCPRGHATLRLAQASGAEPDDAWCIGGERLYPDIVLEIALSSGGVSKLKVYQRFAIPEVWIWRKKALHFYRLRADNSGYDESEFSRFVPTLDRELLYRCVALDSWPEARKAVRTGLGT